jgi:hypothetical protein
MGLGYTILILSYPCGLCINMMNYSGKLIKLINLSLHTGSVVIAW